MHMLHVDCGSYEVPPHVTYCTLVLLKIVHGGHERVISVSLLTNRRQRSVRVLDGDHTSFQYLNIVVRNATHHMRPALLRTINSWSTVGRA